ncbi:hypothetical protein F5B22DRAFT_652421 [Xylaria bambusicola]|uniref:uncharacterized protein n=1 Tax=Xylaria bambusicola TaxID=326684 RepID=UPI002007D5B3|nr:uncharacterized protein F5B22DRAFT_652421 [Xylaria bambusicola]KAI0503111.1 hypothetical protein F5B22DRAFT_652421 [Xylaria bambusicola]
MPWKAANEHGEARVIRTYLESRSRAREKVTLLVDPRPSYTGLVASLVFLDKVIVYAGIIRLFLDVAQRHRNQV